MSIKSYPVGTGVRIRAEFRDDTGALFDPNSVTLTVEDPTGAETPVTPSHPSTGVYTAVVRATTPGDWSYTATGTGGIDAVGNGVFAVTEDLT